MEVIRLITAVVRLLLLVVLSVTALRNRRRGDTVEALWWLVLAVLVMG